MSTDQTPALARATEAHTSPHERASRAFWEAGIDHRPWDEVPEIPKRRIRERMAPALAAALGPDKGRDPVAEALCMHDKSMHHLERTDDFPCSACVSAADAVRAAILGEAS